MSFSKVTRIACACALVFSTLGPLCAESAADDEYAAEQIGSQANDGTEVRGLLTAQDGTPQTASAQTKKRPNLFVRIIRAPFRGLAKLFGGGNKSNQTARVKAKEKPQPPAVPTANEAASGQTDNTTARPESSRAQSQRTRVTENAARNVRAGETTRNAPVVAVAVSPPVIGAKPRAEDASEEAAVDYEPRRFTPYIEGVAGDSLSQGRALLESGFTNEAIAELSVAAVTGPDLVEANNLLGLAYDRRGQHKQAQEYYERARGVAPQNAGVLGNLGHSLYLDDRYRDALAILKSAARLAPADTRIANNLALVYGRLNKYDDAFKQFKRAGGEYYARTQTAALLANAGGRDREAIKHYEAARKLNPASSDVLRQLITLYVRTGQREKAEAAQRVLDKTPHNASTIS